MKYEIKNRWTDAVIFTSEIECSEDAATSIKLGLAVKVAVEARANLARADLARANLTGAYLARANLAGADLARADLADANLTGAKWRDGIIINRAPMQLHGLAYPVYILDDHMQIGCELHSLAEWAAFDDRRIAGMDGITAARFWKANKVALLALAAADGRGVKKDAE